MRRVFLFVSLSFLWPVILNAYDWPIKEDTVQHVILSVMGECRDLRDNLGNIIDSIHHFHRGIDISAPCSTKVYAIEGDTCYIDHVNGYGNGINIGHFRYYHIAGYVYPDTTFIAPGTYFAKTDDRNHVHLQESDVELQHPGDLNDVHWLNPLRNDGGISPFVDTAITAYPVIRDGSAGIKFWRQGTNDTIGRDTMSGRIDISVDARTPWIDSLGRGYDGGASGNMGVYKAFGYIFAQKDTLRLDTLIKFRKIPTS